MQPAHEGSGLVDLVHERRVVVVVDVVESVQLMLANEAETVAVWRAFVRTARERLLETHRGQLIKSLGDGLLLTFPDPANAVACAFRLIALAGEVSTPNTRLALRIGAHADSFYVDDLDVYGSGVNMSARLASIANADEVVCSADIVDGLVAGADADVVDLGDCFLKHFVEPVRAFKLSAATGSAYAQPRSGREIGPSARDSRPRIAILTPWGEGHDIARILIGDEIARRFSTNPHVDTISRMSTRHKWTLDPQATVMELRADYIVCGYCAADATSYTVNFELLAHPTESVLMSQSIRIASQTLIDSPAEALKAFCDGCLQTIQTYVTDIARSVPLQSLSAYSLLTGGVRLMHRLSKADFARSRALLDELALRHPRHPDAFAWLAKWNILRVHQGWSDDPAGGTALAKDYVRRALDLDDSCNVAMVVSGMVKTFHDKRLDDAEATYTQTLSLFPSEPLAWLLKGMVHAFRGEGPEAVRHTTRAAELSPLDPMRYYFDSLAASAHAAAGDYRRAVELAERSLQANVMHASTLRILVIAHAMLDDLVQARLAAKRLMVLEPGFTVDTFLRRSPSAEFQVGRVFAHALERAGIP